MKAVYSEQRTVNSFGTAAVLLLLLAIGVGAQRLSENIELTDGKPCGAPTNKFITTETLVGTVVKRDFAENETVLSGFVLADKKDQRYYVNLDREFIAAHSSGGFVDDLSDLLAIGKLVRIKADVCGKIYLAVRVKALKM